MLFGLRVLLITQKSSVQLGNTNCLVPFGPHRKASVEVCVCSVIPSSRLSQAEAVRPSGVLVATLQSVSSPSVCHPLLIGHSAVEVTPQMSHLTLTGVVPLSSLRQQCWTRSFQPKSSQPNRARPLLRRKFWHLPDREVFVCFQTRRVPEGISAE